MGATRLGIRTGESARTEAALVAKRLEAEVVVIEFGRDAETDLRAALADGVADAVLIPAPALAAGAASDLAAIPKRRDTRDAFVGSGTLESLPAGSRVAVDSRLRRAQVLARRDDLDVVLAAPDQFDGADNRVTSLASLDDPEDAVELFQIDDWPTAPGQGGLVLLTRRGEERLVTAVDHRASRLALLAELGVLARLGASFAPTLAAHALFDDGLLFLSARVYRSDGSEHVTSSHALYPEDAEDPIDDVASRVADELLARGAEDLVGVDT
jgi:hydroxymethylbilane synthase